MTTPKFTPGPWRVQADPQWTGKHPYHEARFITTDDDLAYEPAFSELSRDYMGFSNDAKQSAAIICSMQDSEQQAANATLIASAPDLYAALEALRDKIESDSTAYDNDDDGSLGRAIYAARAALAKARGMKGGE